MANIEFTDRMEMSVEMLDAEQAVVALHAPMFVWLRLDDYVFVGGLRPVFFVDFANLTHLVRGAIEAACEETWEIFEDVFGSGPGPHQDSMLPMCHMRWGKVTTSHRWLKEMARRLREVEGYAPHRELALVAEGFEKVLQERID